MPNNLKDAVSDQKDNIDNIAAGLNGIINTDVYDSLAEHTRNISGNGSSLAAFGAYYAFLVLLIGSQIFQTLIPTINGR